MLGEALSYPRDDEDLVRPYLIGSVLVLCSFIVGVTLIPLYGYLLQVLDDGRTGNRGLPAFEDWETLIIDGLKVFVVNLIYTGIPSIVLSAVGGFIFFVVAIAGFAVGGDGGGGGGALFLVVLLVGGLVTLLAFVFLLVASVMLPAALARMVVEDDFSAALDVRRVFRIAKDGDYLVAVVLAIVVGAGFSMVGGTLSIVLVGIPILLYGFMVVFHLYGQAYARAVENAT
ncbi:MAG: DUF4013 domain-containing protein [Haloferacaceae archaeon]